MKKLLAFFFCAVLISQNIFTESNDLSNGNGNGGKDKIGAWLGVPFIGLSYSHEFNDLIEFDLLIGSTGIPLIARIVNIRSALLFTVWEPVIKGQNCPLTIGTAIDINSWAVLYKPASIGVAVLFPIRWEVNFEKISAFNLFIEAAPAIGFTYYYGERNHSFAPNNESGLFKKTINDQISIDWIPHIGLGLRYRIPNKK